MDFIEDLIRHPKFTAIFVLLMVALIVWDSNRRETKLHKVAAYAAAHDGHVLKSVDYYGYGWSDYHYTVSLPNGVVVDEDELLRSGEVK